MMSYQWLTVSKYQIGGSFGRQGWPPRPRSTARAISGSTKSPAGAPSVLILRMARLSPKVQLVALVGSGQPDA